MGQQPGEWGGPKKQFSGKETNGEIQDICYCFHFFIFFAPVFSLSINLQQKIATPESCVSATITNEGEEAT